ncbi:MAG TPA: TonB family protein [Terriglobales bacterium]
MLSVFFVSDCPDLHYNGVGLDDLSPSDAMPSNRPNLTLDEQSFQGLLSAAFTIQEYNDRRKLARQTPARQTQAEPEAHPEPEADRLCEHCGALMPADASRCGSCGRDEFRPGERMQPNWASMWLMSQEQGSWPERPPEIREGARNSVKPPAAKRRPRAQAAQDFASNGFLALPVAKEAAKETITQEKTETIHDRAFDTSALDKAEAKSQWITEATEHLTPEDLAPEDPELTVQPFQLSARDDSSPTDASIDAPTDASIDAPTDASIDASGASTDLLNCVPNHLLREIVQQALQATHATGAAIALEEQGELICRAVAGDSASEIGTRINTGSGPTGVCASSGTMQLCSNTELDSRVDADACRELGVSAVMVVPLLHQDQLLGLIEVFSRRPYAFGMRDLQALQDLAEQFTANLQLSAESANANTGHESPGVSVASGPLGGERNQGHFAGMRKFGLYTLAVIACVLIGFYWAWKPLDPMTNPAKGQVTLISTVPAVPARLSLSQVVEGTLLHRVDPTYPMDALRQGIQGQVVLQVRISKDGLVYGAKAIRGEPILSQAAVEAVRQWRFSPYRMNNKPFDVAAQITFKFSLVK